MKNIFYYVLFLFSIAIQAQNQAPLSRFLSTESSKNWFFFNEQNTINNLPQIKKEFLDLHNGYDLQLKATTHDDLGFTHYRFQQTYLTIPIEGKELIIHEKEGLLQYANGYLTKCNDLTVTPNLSAESALQKAINYMGATTYAWQTPAYENIKKDLDESANASFYPTPTLVLVNIELGKTQYNIDTTFKLAYKIDLFAAKPMKREWVYVDAHNGSIITSINQICAIDAACTGNASHTCTSTVDITGDYNGSYYRLRESDRGNGIVTFTSDNSNSYPTFDIASTDNHFNEDPVAVTAHWGTEQTYDYYLDTHGRNSFNDNGAKLRSWVHYDNNYNNAFWNGAWMTYGDGDGSVFDPLVSLDVIAHEITHGVINYSANLLYAYEPGALNESFSDIFGAAVEFAATPTCADWIIGEDITTSGSGIRNMSDPNLHNQPNTYEGDYWYTGSDDYGGVHYNSGVQNFWFYLLAEGGNGTNDNGHTYSVSGIGIDKAAAIAYRNLTVYLSNNSEYIDARNGAIQAAIDLYGAGSNEVNQVVAAWCAVGVGPNTCTTSTNSITLTNPNGGELWQYGDTQTITWTSVGDFSEVEIEYSTNNGSSWINISHNTNNDGSFSWIIPNSTTNIAKVRITDTNDTNTKDKSDEVFNLQGCTVLADFMPSDTEICAGESITYSNLSTEATAYTWQIDAVVQTTNTNFTHTFTTAGNYIISLTSSSNANCSDSYSEIITVNPAPTATFAYTTNNLNVNFFADDGGASTYNWTADGINIASTANPTYTFNNVGTYEVCLNITSNCSTTSNCETLTLSNTNCVETWRQYLNGDETQTILEVDTYIFVGTLNAGLIKVDTLTGETVSFNITNSDLPHNNVYALLESSNGEIFVGTNNGMAKFDGNNPTAWTIYNTANSDLPSNVVYTLLENSNQEIFVGTNNGLAKFDGNNPTAWTIYNNTNSDLPSNVVYTLLENSNQEIFVGTNNGLAKFDGNNPIGWTIYNTANSDLPSNFISTLLENSNQEIFVGTNNGLAKFDGNNPIGWTIYNTANFCLPNNTVNTLLENSDGEIFVGTNGGLVKSDESDPIGWIVYNSTNSNLPNNNVYALLESNQGIFVSTNGGLAKFNGNSYTEWTVYNTISSDLPNSNVNSLLQSSSGEIFVGTNNGLAKFDGYSLTGWTIYNTANSDLPSNHIRVLLESSNQEIFVGTNNGLAKFDGNNPIGWIIYNTANSELIDNYIWTLLESSNQEIFVGTSEVTKFDGNNPIGWTTYNTTNSDLPSGHVYTLLESSNQEIFVSSFDGGLAKFDGNNPTGWTIYDNTNSDLPYNHVWTLLESSNGEIFAGADGVFGLAKFDGNNPTGWTIYNTANSDLPNDIIHALLESSNGEIFVGTHGGGVARFDGNNPTGWTIYNTANSDLPNDYVNSLLESNSGEIFVGTIGGLGVLSPVANTVATFTKPTTICSNTTSLFTNTSTGATTYEWQLNGTTISNNTDLNYTFTTAGTYMLTLIATNANCSNFYQEQITVNNNANNLALDEISSNCTGLNTHVIDAGLSDMALYLWDFEGSNVGTSQTITVSQSGLYTLTVIDQCGNTNADEIEILLDTDCVWPGDFNYDNVVNNQDLLMIGLAFGDTGSVRPNASLEWQAQAAHNWFGNTTPNKKHIDGDGNGIIDLNDPNTIVQNYGQTHGNLPIPPVATSPLNMRVQASIAPSIGNNSIIIMELFLDDPDVESLVAYGNAFTVNCLFPDAIAINNITVDFTDSWLGINGLDLFTMVEQVAIDNNDVTLGIALTRLDHKNKIGAGSIARIITDIDVLPTLETLNNVAVSLNNIQMTLANGSSIVGGEGAGGIVMGISPSTATFNLSLTPPCNGNESYLINAKVLLQGAYIGDGWMSIELKNANLLPNEQPFNDSPWYYEGTETTNTIPANATDWVLVEIQDFDNNTIIEQQAAFVRNDGRLLDMMGNVGINFCNVSDNGNYRLLIRSRNHLAVAAANMLVLPQTDLYDFTNANNVLGGSSQLSHNVDNYSLMIGGDFNGDGIISVSDFNTYLGATATINQYHPADCNLDGSVTVSDFNTYFPNASTIGVSLVRY